MTAILTTAAVVLVAVVVMKEFGILTPEPPSSRDDFDLSGELAPIERASREIASEAGALRVIEFLDLQCPACADYHTRVLSRLDDSLPAGAFSLKVVHLPLQIHPHAIDAARASECAFEQSRFSEYLGVALAAQRRFREQPWLELATTVGVADTTKFRACMQRGDTAQQILAGLSASDALGVRATPTLVVNGILRSQPPSLAELLKIARTSTVGR